MVRAAGRPHEDGLATELVGDDLEAEDAAVELGGDGRVPDEQDGVVEAGDGDAHLDSVALDVAVSTGPVMRRPARWPGRRRASSRTAMSRRWRC